MLFHKGGGDAGKKPNIGTAVTALERLELRLSGMRLTETYEIVVSGAAAEISHYTESYANGTAEQVLRRRAVCETQAVIDALNGFDFARWNGFHGAHPKGVLDGTMFRLTATLNGGQTLRADGSQNFPKRFFDFEQWLNDALKDGSETE